MPPGFQKTTITFAILAWLTSPLRVGGEYVSVSQELAISDLVVLNVSSTSATISWTTDYRGDSELELWRADLNVPQKRSDPALVTDHRVTATGLQPNHTYYFRVQSTGLKGQFAVSTTRTFRTVRRRGEEQVLIFNLSVRDVTSQSATISWQSDRAATSEALLIGAEGASIRQEDLQLAVDHRLTFSNLAEGEEYTYHVTSSDANGISSQPVKGVFVTDSGGGSNRPPVAVLQVMGKPLWNGQIRVRDGEVVHFRGSSSHDVNGDSLYFRWTFGDGGVSEERDPSHKYVRAGLYEVNLTVDDDQWPRYPANPFVIPTQQPALTLRGGIIVADFDGDGLLDYAVSTKDDPVESEATYSTIGVYGHHGTTLWVKHVDVRMNTSYYGLPGRFGPGIAAGDVDGDNETELLHLDTKNSLVVRNGLSGEVEEVVALPTVTHGPGFWGHFQIVNLRGSGDSDLILQAEVFPNPDHNRNKFPWLTAFSLQTRQVLWSTDAYDGVRHGGFRAADIDGDGRDEVVGAVMFDHTGQRMNEWDYRLVENPGHLDALYVADVRPLAPGLEVVILEERGGQDDRVAICGVDTVFAYASHQGDEPQNAAIGNFDPARPGLEIWCRSRFDVDQKPWVLDQDGNVIAEWFVNKTKPAGWTTAGLELISRIDWYGGLRDVIAAKERHKDGDVALIDPMTGEFIHTWQEEASRLFVADVAGDYREEIVVLNNSASEIRIYWNEAVNPNSKARYWHHNDYQRQKQNYNYYSP